LLAAISLTICAVCTYAALPTFWTLPTAFLTGSAAAAGIALVNSIGNIGGFVGPDVMGRLTKANGTPTLGLAFLSGCYVIAGLVTLILGHDRRIEMAGSIRPAQ
jgi:MFS transporter, ACS family, tartrate transporter